MVLNKVDVDSDGKSVITNYKRKKQRKARTNLTGLAIHTVKYSGNNQTDVNPKKIKISIKVCRHLLMTKKQKKFFFGSFYKKLAKLFNGKRIILKSSLDLEILKI